MKQKEIQGLIDNFIEERDNYDLETQCSKVKYIYQMAKDDLKEGLEKMDKAHLFDEEEQHKLLVFICKSCCSETSYDVYYSLRVNELIFD